MKTFAFVTLFFLVASLNPCSGQKLKHGYIRDRKVNSFQQIIDLKEGYLLIMLHTKQNQIEALLSRGKEMEADKIRWLQADKNKNIIKAFRKHFDFCPVYFFFNSQANELIGKGITSITFINDDLLPDSSIHPDREKFFVGEFGNMQSDTAKYFTGYRLSNRDMGAYRKPEYYSTSTYNYQAFTIQSPILIQLKKPFPYFVMITETTEKVVKIELVVAQMNRRLFMFYEKSKLKILNKRFSPYFKESIAELN